MTHGYVKVNSAAKMLTAPLVANQNVGNAVYTFAQHYILESLRSGMSIGIPSLGLIITLADALPELDTRIHKETSQDEIRTSDNQLAAFR